MNATINRLGENLIRLTSPGAATLDNYVAKYVPLRYRTPSPNELDTRRTAQDFGYRHKRDV